MPNTKQIALIVTAFFAVLVLALSTKIFETNNAGYYQILQAAGTGKMSVRAEPGIFLQAFGDVTTYTISDVYEFGKNTANPAINVRFNDAATADVAGQIKFRLSMKPEDMLRLHQDFRSYKAVEADLVRQGVTASLTQSATLFGAEEVYSTRRSDFINLVDQQIKRGIFDTTYSESLLKDEDGGTFIKRNVNVRIDTNGNPIIAQQSAFQRYGVEVIQIVIRDVDFDEKTQELIAKRKEAEQEKVVAKAKAERAKQDAITAQEVGRANVATAEAEALVIKKKAVIEAEKSKEVAAQQALQAAEEKKATIAKGEADAEASALKVKAGLSPLERAQIDRDTAIGVAEKLAQIKFPELLIIGGNGQQSTMNPFDAVGLQSFIKISKDLSEKNSSEK